MTEMKSYPFEKGDTVKISFEAVVTSVSDDWADFEVDSYSGYLDIQGLPENTKYKVVKKNPREVGWWELEVTESGSPEVYWWDGYLWKVGPKPSQPSLSKNPHKIGSYLGSGAQDDN